MWICFGRVNDWKIKQKIRRKEVKYKQTKLFNKVQENVTKLMKIIKICGKNRQENEFTLRS